MKYGFAQNLTIVTVAHFAVIVCIVLIAAMPRIRQPSRVVIPVQLQVFDPAAQSEGAQAREVVREVAVLPDPEPQAEPVVEKLPDPPKPAPRQETGISKPTTKPTTKPTVKKKNDTKSKSTSQTKRNARTNVKRRQAVSAKDIADALRPAVGSRVGHSQTGVNIAGALSADADAPYFGVLKDAFYDAWIQPSYADAGGAAATVAFELIGDGLVTRKTLAKSSGNPVMDASVMQAVNSVSRVAGLPADFVRKHREIEIVFRVER
ncbi:MAG: TonB family protein [bacterium]